MPFFSDTLTRIHGWGASALLVLLVGVRCLCAAPPTAQELDQQVNELVGGAHVRVVWSQDLDDSRDTWTHDDHLRLMGYDNRDGQGVRVIVGREDTYHRPMLTPDGKRVVYTNYKEKASYIVNFDGSTEKKICDGVATDVWRDPQTGKDYLIYGGERSPAREYTEVLRRPLEGWGGEEVIWSKADATISNFQLSADGTRASGQFPWPHSGVVVLPNQSWQPYGKGCWTSLSPDNSYLMWVLDGPHRNVTIYDTRVTDGSARWKVNINRATGVDGYEVYHPRWSNHPRFLTMTGPFKEGTSGNRISGGGPAVEVYVGRFSENIHFVEDWTRITYNNAGDFTPDVWIEGGEKVVIESAGPTELDRSALPDAPEDLEGYEAWPGDRTDLEFIWEGDNKPNQIVLREGEEIRACRVEARGRAKFGRFFDMDLLDGGFIAVEAGAALVNASRRKNQMAIEAVITPYHSQQKGPARIISLSKNTDQWNFFLGQKNDVLTFGLRTTETVTQANPLAPILEMTKLKPLKRHHVIVSYLPGNLYCFVDGVKVYETDIIQGGFDNWGLFEVIFGTEWDGSLGWEGRLEGVALYSRFVTPEEASHKFDLYRERFKERPTAPRLKVKAKLVEITKTPPVEALQEYARALTVYCYEIVKINQGEEASKRILVAHWAIMNRKPIESLNQRQIGKNYNLNLQRYEDHPQLESERQFNDCSDILLPLYYDVGRIE